MEQQSSKSLGRLSQRRLRKEAMDALNKKFKEGFGKQIGDVFLKNNEQAFLDDLVEDITGEKRLRYVHDFSILISVACKYPGIGKDLHRETTRITKDGIGLDQLHDLSLSYNTELNGPLTTFLSKKKPTKQDKAELLRHWIKSFEQQYSTKQKIKEQEDRETNENEKK